MMQRGWRMTRPGIRGIGVSVVLGIAVSTPAVAEESEAASPIADPATEQTPSTVTLDRLLTLPTALNVESGRKGGATRAEWHSRFATAETEIATAKEALEESLGKLDELAGEASNWKVGAPGVQINPDDESPLNFGLRQEIRRRREDVERAERGLRELFVEASLAGIPENWYRPE
jgi:hypothetical protein